MKIRNKYDGTTIESMSSIKEESYFYRLISLGNCNILFKHDGWEEIKDEDWHDLRKNPDDLPKEAGLYFCKYYTNSLHDICDYDVMRYDTHFKFCAHNDKTKSGWCKRYEYPCSRNKDVIVWRKLPKFEEE